MTIRFSIRKIILALIFLLLLPLFFDLERPITEAEANRKAQTALNDYAAREKIPSSDFSEPPARSSEAGRPFIFDYESQGHPKHLVRIYIDKSGYVEIKRMIDE